MDSEFPQPMQVSRSMRFRTEDDLNNEFKKRANILLSSLNPDPSDALQAEYKRRAKLFLDKLKLEAPEVPDSDFKPTTPEKRESPQPSTSYAESQPSPRFAVFERTIRQQSTSGKHAEEFPQRSPKPSTSRNIDIYEFTESDDPVSDNDEGSLGADTQTPPPTTVGLEVRIQTTQQRSLPFLTIPERADKQTQKPKPKKSQKKGKSKSTKKIAKYQSTKKAKAEAEKAKKSPPKH